LTADLVRRLGLLQILPIGQTECGNFSGIDLVCFGLFSRLSSLQEWIIYKRLRSEQTDITKKVSIKTTQRRAL
ncbi:MAG: hypothetical protein PUE85_02080, partial [Firmicutes bacterium]|nr:hypothetical protein [Bacillota bacterium]